MIVTIESANPKDIEAIQKLDAEVLGSPARRTFLEKSVFEDKVILARSDDSLAGFVVVNQNFYGHTFIELLIVSPDCRRQGIGSMLVREVELHCHTEKLFTSTNESNETMQLLCQSLGFTKSGNIGNIGNLDEGDPEIVYFKRVQGEEEPAAQPKTRRKPTLVRAVVK